MSDVASFIREIAADPRQHLTKTLLDAIAEVWQGEPRIHCFTLDIWADPEFELSDSIMIWNSRVDAARARFREFEQMHLVAADDDVPGVAVTEKDMARWEVVDAEARVVRAHERLAEAQRRLAQLNMETPDTDAD